MARIHTFTNPQEARDAGFWYELSDDMGGTDERSAEKSTEELFRDIPLTIAHDVYENGIKTVDADEFNLSNFKKMLTRFNRLKFARHYKARLLTQAEEKDAKVVRGVKRKSTGDAIFDDESNVGVLHARMASRVD